LRHIGNQCEEPTTRMVSGSSNGIVHQVAGTVAENTSRGIEAANKVVSKRGAGGGLFELINKLTPMLGPEIELT
jgi:hypothetical protein